MNDTKETILKKVISGELALDDCDFSLKNDREFLKKAITEITSREQELYRKRGSKICPWCGNNRFVIDFNAIRKVESGNAKFWSRDIFGRKMEFCSVCGFDINKTVAQQGWLWKSQFNSVVKDIVKTAQEEQKESELLRQQEVEVEKRKQHKADLQDATKKQYEKYSKLRKEIEAMPEYKKWRAAILERDRYQCSICGKKENLEVDHRYLSFYSIVKKYNITNVTEAYECPVLWNVNNGAVLCKDCHDKTQKSQRYFANNV